MSVNDVSHRLLSVQMQEKNAIAEAAILNTDRGKNLQEILKGGGSVGVSMRGTGTTRLYIHSPGRASTWVDALGP